MNNPHREHENVSILLCQINFWIVVKSLRYLQIVPFIFSKGQSQFFNELSTVNPCPPKSVLLTSLTGSLCKFETVAR